MTNLIFNRLKKKINDFVTDDSSDPWADFNQPTPTSNPSNIAERLMTKAGNILKSDDISKQNAKKYTNANSEDD